MNRDQYPCARHVSCGEALVPVHARNRDECPLNNRDEWPSARHVSCGEALVPVRARNRDECPLNNRDEWPPGPVRGPGLKNRDECIAFVPVCGPTGMNGVIGSGRKVRFLLVHGDACAGGGGRAPACVAAPTAATRRPLW